MISNWVGAKYGKKLKVMLVSKHLGQPIWTAHLERLLKNHPLSGNIHDQQRLTTLIMAWRGLNDEVHPLALSSGLDYKPALTPIQISLIQATTKND